MLVHLHDFQQTLISTKLYARQRERLEYKRTTHDVGGSNFQTDRKTAKSERRKKQNLKHENKQNRTKIGKCIKLLLTNETLMYTKPDSTDATMVEQTRAVDELTASGRMRNIPRETVITNVHVFQTVRVCTSKTNNQLYYVIINFS